MVIPSPGSGERHDLALVSLAFDPPLQTISSISAAQQVKLVAVVDNRGTEREQNVVVTAVVRSLDSGETLAWQTGLIDSLAPGEARVVRFGYVGSLPYAMRYAVTVRVAPVPDEIVLENNEATLFVGFDPQ